MAEPLPSVLDAIHASGRSSRAPRLCDSLRAAIPHGDLAPGTPLPEKVVASVTAAGGMPVGEAPHRLEVGGLVESNGRGMAVIDVFAHEPVELCIGRATIWQVSRDRFLARQLGLLRNLIERREDSTLRDPERQHGSEQR
jgi:hypothetical protein